MEKLTSLSRLAKAMLTSPSPGRLSLARSSRAPLRLASKGLSSSVSVESRHITMVTKKHFAAGNELALRWDVPDLFEPLLQLSHRVPGRELHLYIVAPWPVHEATPSHEL
mmetsp:Transcript_60164/g.130481  ORF Transcript_60164/g.130481 Transcript_60164/m.130481 type:complete len:110 (+) Transcript_60164:478-807(+)